MWLPPNIETAKIRLKVAATMSSFGDAWDETQGSVNAMPTEAQSELWVFLACKSGKLPRRWEP